MGKNSMGRQESDMKFQCEQCKSILTSGTVTDGAKVTCPVCGAETVCRPYGASSRLCGVAASDGKPCADENPAGTIHAKMASAIGIEKLKGFSLSDLFSEVFSKHSRAEVENYFTIGTEKSTPDILDVDASWPKPWLFTRMIIASLALYFLMWFGWKMWANSKLLPGLMLIGSFAIPISTLVLFVELNVRRNVSLYMVVRLAFLGGIFSLLITHFLPVTIAFLSPLFGNWSVYLGASVAGPLEESAKVLAMVAVASAAKYRYKLNGLLVGAAVGTGFSAFESAGYAFDIIIAGVSAGVGVDAVNDMVYNINMRGLMSPFTHIVWSAIAGCALWRVINGQKFKWRMLCDEKFIRLLLVPVILHMIWNSPFQLPYFGTYIILGFVGWFVCLSLVQEGLHEIVEEQKESYKISMERMGSPTEGVVS